MAKALVIVESPAKAKTIQAMLGSDYVVESSIGHIRDLPNGADEVPAVYKGEDWARLGVNVNDGFKPIYVVSRNKKDVVKNLKAQLAKVDQLFLATDEDREGESIAWHLLEVLNPGPKVDVRRMVFHEITRAAIERAVVDSRELDRRLVDAQEARRILDRLYGYEVSPVLWKKVLPRLSAGRVQSVATRLVVERERERMAFTSATWHDVTATFTKTPDSFGATLVSLGGVDLAGSKDFDSTGSKTSDRLALDGPSAAALSAALPNANFTVTSVTEKPFTSRPQPPFMTSTLQQEAGRKLRLSAQRAMQTAQRLYEQGWITYMRTDSTTLSDQALQAARSQARELYGEAYVPAEPRRYERKVKNAQEAHEAIRPAGETFRTPDEAARSLSGDEFRLYELIWMRTVASQMADARGTSAQVRLTATVPGSAAAFAGQDAEFQANGRVIAFPGYRRAYVEGADDPEAELADQEKILPALAVGDIVTASDFEAVDHHSQPPARYTDASLVKKMEELGIGRPSTYASVISTIQDRGYVWKKGPALVPSFIAFAVVSLLEQHFSDLVDYNFTASMEDDLDAIASGQEEALPWLSRFYFGDDAAGTETERIGLKSAVTTHIDEIDPRAINTIVLGADENGEMVVVRSGKYGPYLQRGEERASIPDDTLPDELTVERALELLHAPSQDRELGADPATGLPVFAKAGRYGPYVQLGEMEGTTKPKTASLFKDMDLGTLTLEDALTLLSIPRTVGVDPESNLPIETHNGRYGPYVKRGTDSRSLETEQQLLTLTMDEALAIFAQPKQRGRRAAAPPLKELGPDPVTGVVILLKEGRFGPYVTDGTTNASLRKGDTVEELTPERAAELLADRRAAGPSKKATKKAAAKKAPAKKAAAKKTVKKATAKKAAAKKTPAKKTPAKKAVALKAGSAAQSED